MSLFIALLILATVSLVKYGKPHNQINKETVPCQRDDAIFNYHVLLLVYRNDFTFSVSGNAMLHRITKTACCFLSVVCLWMHFLEHLPGNLALQCFDFFGPSEAVSVTQWLT